MLSLRILSWTLLLLAMVPIEVAMGRRIRVSGDSTSVRTDKIMSLGTQLALGAGIVGSLIIPGSEIPPSWLWLTLGILLGLFGLALRALSMRALGNFFTLTPHIDGHQVIVTTGPYAVVRHPGYSALILYIVGLELIVGTWAALISSLFVALPLPLRIAVEEGLLRAHSDDAYDDYCRKTRRRLIPWLL
jgi:protein-S-isoprenylcysteine O-methyltransferase Ste14